MHCGIPICPKFVSVMSEADLINWVEKNNNFEQQFEVYLAGCELTIATELGRRLMMFQKSGRTPGWRRIRIKQQLFLQTSVAVCWKKLVFTMKKELRKLLGRNISNSKDDGAHVTFIAPHLQQNCALLSLALMRKTTLSESKAGFGLDVTSLTAVFVLGFATLRKISGFLQLWIFARPRRVKFSELRRNQLS